jgi:hypothetical protein
MSCDLMPRLFAFSMVTAAMFPIFCPPSCGRLRRVMQTVAGWLAGLLLRVTYGVRFTDMSPFRAMRVDRLRLLHMAEPTYGWNLEMQMRAAAAGCRIVEIPVDHRCRRGGVSKVSGNAVAGLHAGWKITTTFLRLAMSQRTA